MKKNKKLIIVFLVLLLVILISVTIIYVYNLSNTKENGIASNIEEKQEHIEDTNSIQNVLEENTLASAEIIEENTIKTEEINNIDTNEKKTDNVANQEQKKVAQKTTNKESNPVTTPQESSVAQPVTISKPVTQPIVETNKAPEVQTPSAPEPVVTPTAPTEEYKYNDSMTQTMINIINSNPSQYMQMDGFNVVIDSSITALTNQFTFTEERVKNKIANKAGTIKVYAQDYYCNGELLFTECYIF